MAGVLEARPQQKTEGRAEVRMGASWPSINLHVEFRTLKVKEKGGHADLSEATSY